jgi:pyruvate formate lyase activating enzyme
MRENHDGALYTLVYGRTIARHVDPLEKRQLLHFYPGSRAYSIATPGCNFRCQWCQNADISQASPAKPTPEGEGSLLGQTASSAEIVNAAKWVVDCRSVAYTYTEPTIFFEYSCDTAQLAHDEDIADIYVTNGFMTEQMLEAFAPYLDAANVDLKAFRDKTYREYVAARLQPVLDSLKNMKELGIWVEVTTAVIPDINDTPDELRDAASFIADELGPETPWHISRFHPSYKMAGRSPTSPSKPKQAQEIELQEGLHYVYVGNVPGESNTVCRACEETLICRFGYRLVRISVERGSVCPRCGTSVAGVGMEGAQS